MNNKDQILETLFALQRFGIKPGLERTYALLEKVGNPHEKIKTIHVAGTNGKGSICSMLSSILYESGLKTGLYTSPHIHDFNERIKINGEMISDIDLIEISKELLKYQEEIGSTFFEITTVLAFKYFEMKKVDIAVIETGMGGRFDSTNVLLPELSIITKIGVDHQEYLGNTIEEIAFEKAGIVKLNTPIVLMDCLPKVKDVVRAKAKEEKAQFIPVSDYADISCITYNEDFSTNIDLSIKDKEYQDIHLPLPGYHQVNNLATTLLAINSIADLNIKDEDIYSGIKNVHKNCGLLSRIEVLRSEPLIITDAAHNPDATQSLVDTILQHGHSDEKWNIVFGAMKDKDVYQSLDILSEICNEMLCVNASMPRAVNSGKLAMMAEEKGIKSRAFPSIKMGIDAALKLNRNTIITGSFFILSEAIKQIKNQGI